MSKLLYKSLLAGLLAITSFGSNAGQIFLEGETSTVATFGSPTLLTSYTLQSYTSFKIYNPNNFQVTAEIQIRDFNLSNNPGEIDVKDLETSGIPTSITIPGKSVYKLDTAIDPVPLNSAAFEDETLLCPAPLVNLFLNYLGEFRRHGCDIRTSTLEVIWSDLDIRGNTSTRAVTPLQVTKSLAYVEGGNRPAN